MRHQIICSHYYAVIIDNPTISSIKFNIFKVTLNPQEGTYNHQQLPSVRKTFRSLSKMYEKHDYDDFDSL